MEKNENYCELIQNNFINKSTWTFQLRTGMKQIENWKFLIFFNLIKSFGFEFLVYILLR